MAKKPSNHRKEWTAAEVRQLQQLADRNTPTRLMALKLGRTEVSVRAKAQELDVSLKPVNQKPYNRRSQ